MASFEDQLQSLCAHHATKADADEFGVMIERLAAALGFTIAIAARGDPEAINTMIEGATAHALSEAAHKAPFARMVRSAKGGS